MTNPVGPGERDTQTTRDEAAGDAGIRDETAAIRVTILLGPTGSGKSAVGYEIARRVGAEIISADSMQIYRGMDIGTAKLSLAERAEVPHHLIDVCEPCEPFSVAEFVRQADLAASEIHGRGRRVLMVGGTALYLKGFMEGIFEGAGGDPGIRARLAEESARIGVQGLHDRLRVVDPVAAMRIHPNDLRRIVRALEVYETTGQPISAWQHQEGQERPQYEFRLFGLRMPRERLYERINARVRHMVDAGLVEETRELAERSPGVGQWASQALGYRDMMEHLRGECSLEDAIARIQKGTRRLAKRQICWFKRFRGVRWVDLDGTEDPVRLAVSLLPEFSH